MLYWIQEPLGEMLGSPLLSHQSENANEFLCVDWAQNEALLFNVNDKFPIITNNNSLIIYTNILKRFTILSKNVKENKGLAELLS